MSHTPDKRPLPASPQDLTEYKNLYLLTDLGRLDIFGSLPPSGTAEEVLADAEPMEVGGVRVRVVSLRRLISVKAAMGRPKDKQTEVELRAIADARAAMGKR